MRRGTIMVVVAAMLLAAMAVPAGASKAPAAGADPADGHKITICHATRSLSNPYVEITIDVAAWNDPDDDKNHGDHHTRTKDGVTWSDYILEEGDECGIDAPLYCDGQVVDFKVPFSGDKLVSFLTPPSWGYDHSETVDVNIPVGTYDLILGSSDDRGTNLSEVQDNERWRAVFSDGSMSLYSPDLLDHVPSPFVVSWGGTVEFRHKVGSVTANHFDVDDVSTTFDSVIPEFVCLIEKTGSDL